MLCYASWKYSLWLIVCLSFGNDYLSHPMFLHWFKCLIEWFLGKTGLYLGLKGCLEKFDELAGTFSRNPGGKDREKVIREVKRIIRKLEKKKSPEWKLQRANIYLKIMTAAGPNVMEYVDSEKIRMLIYLMTKLVAINTSLKSYQVSRPSVWLIFLIFHWFIYYWQFHIWVFFRTSFKKCYSK